MLHSCIVPRGSTQTARMAALRDPEIKAPGLTVPGPSLWRVKFVTGDRIEFALGMSESNIPGS